MDNHKNAPLTPKGREAMVRSVVEGGLAKASPRCSSTWQRKRLPDVASASARKAWTGCVIAPLGSFHCRAYPAGEGRLALMQGSAKT